MADVIQSPSDSNEWSQDSDNQLLSELAQTKIHSDSKNGDANEETTKSSATGAATGGGTILNQQQQTTDKSSNVANNNNNNISSAAQQQQSATTTTTTTVAQLQQKSSDQQQQQETGSTKSSATQQAVVSSSAVNAASHNNATTTTAATTNISSASSGAKMRISGKNEEKKIFVGGISWDTTEDDLKTFFGQFGEVSHVQIKYDHFTGRSRGFAFVEFAASDACQKSLQNKEYDLKSKKIEIKPAKSRENKKIFVGGLPGDFTEEELRKHFDQYGKIEEIEWPFDKFQNRRKNFAFIVFEDEDATQKAAAQPKQKFGDRMCDVKIAVPQYMRPQRPYNMPPVAAYGAGGGGWNEFAGYGAATYGSYGGGYGNPTTAAAVAAAGGGYYDDYYANYDYGAAAAAHNATAAAAAAAATPYDYSSWQGNTAVAGYDGWGYGGVSTGTGSVAQTNPTRPTRGGYAGYGGY